MTVLFFLLLPLAAHAQESNIATGDITRSRLISEKSAFAPAEPFLLALELTHKDGWHSYTDPSGEAGLPTAITWELPTGFAAGPILWPPPTTMKEGDITTYGYKDRALLPVRITPPADARPGDIYAMRAKATWLVCNEICIPESAELTITLPAADASTPSQFADILRSSSAAVAQYTPSSSSGLTRGSIVNKGMDGRVKPDHDNARLLPALLLALLGGIVLNLMPCVFPVLSLKCLAVARQSGISRSKSRAEGIAYTAGVLTCFAVIAGLLIALTQAGDAIGWGFQMQSPGFVAFMALLLFLIGLNLSGFFSLPVLFGHVGVEITQEPTLTGSFLTGALATLVATPCTAPFMASAIGYALAQPPLVALLVFEALGLGLALPFLLVSFFPALLARLPKPGAWMETMKQLLAFPMYLSAVWLAWVLTQQASAAAIGVLLLTAALLVFLFWCRRFFASDSRAYHLGATLLVVGLSAGAIGIISNLPAASAASQLLHGGEAYSEQRLNELRAQGKPVFVDATAAWCITCQVNYHSTLGTDAVQNAFREKGVTFMVADWTKGDESITAFLASFGYRGVPLYVYFPANNGEPKVLPQILTPQIVVDSL